MEVYACAVTRTSRDPNYQTLTHREEGSMADFVVKEVVALCVGDG